ncbi:MAG: hypothetical protein PVG66_03195 [Chromatiales bacterium]|jgi:hypothetical protein
MTAAVVQFDAVSKLCETTDVADGIQALQQGLARLFPDLQFEHVLTRGHWHRLGGVVDANYQRVSDNIVHWAEQESGGDAEELVIRYMDHGYFATNLAGKTLYFTAANGDEATDFIQLEIEQLQEVLDRPLVERDWFPESLEEFLDPLDYPRLEPEPVGKAYFRFRRMTPIKPLLTKPTDENQAMYNLRRFFHDWQNSSANDAGHFSQHWVLALQEFKGSDGELKLNAKPVSTFADKLPSLPPEGLSGSELARAIHDYDRALGFHFAWFFMMLTRKAENFALFDAVLRDQVGAYDYLPAKDLKVLRDWESRPYGV